jgi:hypothetical protein
MKPQQTAFCPILPWDKGKGTSGKERGGHMPSPKKPPSRKKLPSRGKKKPRIELQRSKRKKREIQFPNQSELDKCEIRITKSGDLWCERLSGCDGQCHLFSLPRNNPKAKPKDEGVFTEQNPFEPNPRRYYFCRCVEDVQN